MDGWEERETSPWILDMNSYVKPKEICGARVNPLRKYQRLCVLLNIHGVKPKTYGNTQCKHINS